MSKEETVKILAVLKAAYPNFYRNLDVTEAKGVINLWSIQFCKIPADIVYMAVMKLVSTNTFPPTISEVKSKLTSMHYEALAMLITDNVDGNEDELNRIAHYCKMVDTEQEPSIGTFIEERRKALEAHDKQ